MFGQARSPREDEDKDEDEDEDEHELEHGDGDEKWDESDNETDSDLYNLGSCRHEPPNNQHEGPSRSTTLFDSTFGDLGLAASIFRIRGSPTAETWPVRIDPSSSRPLVHLPFLCGVLKHVPQDFKDLPDANKIQFTPFPTVSLSLLIPSAPPLAVDLIEKLLALSPARRLVARESLDHPFFLGGAVLMPTRLTAWYGTGTTRHELEKERIVREADGMTMVQRLQPWLDAARARYDRLRDRQPDQSD